ncbi:hypothetical protein PRNP1_014841 [Phytophthora ramorum]
METPSGMTSSVTGLAGARGAQLYYKLDKMSDSIAGHTVVDPKGYLAGLKSIKLTSDAEIGDIKKARLLLRSVTLTNPKHGPGWIAATRLEEVAGKIAQARKIGRSPEDWKRTWMDDAENSINRGALFTAKAIYASALKVFPGKKSIWLRAVALEKRVQEGKSSEPVE